MMIIIIIITSATKFVVSAYHFSAGVEVVRAVRTYKSRGNVGRGTCKVPECCVVGVVRLS